VFGNTDRHHLSAGLVLVTVVGGDVVIFRAPFIRMKVRVQEVCSVEVRIPELGRLKVDGARRRIHDSLCIHMLARPEIAAL